MKLDCAPENQVGFGKRVGIADGSKADAFSRPGAKTFGCEQGSLKRHRVLGFRKRNCSAQHPPAKVANRFFARYRGPDLAEIGF